MGDVPHMPVWKWVGSDPSFPLARGVGGGSMLALRKLSVT